MISRHVKFCGGYASVSLSAELNMFVLKIVAAYKNDLPFHDDHVMISIGYNMMGGCFMV